MRLSVRAYSALAVLASGSGVSTERETFMDLVKTEITRLNGEVSNRGSMSMVFHHGGVHVSRQLHRRTCLCSHTSETAHMSVTVCITDLYCRDWWQNKEMAIRVPSGLRMTHSSFVSPYAYWSGQHADMPQLVLEVGMASGCCLWSDLFLQAVPRQFAHHMLDWHGRLFISMQ